MSNRFTAKTSRLSLIMNGRFNYLLNPWTIILDFDSQRIIIKQRNWYFIGTDEETFNFTKIRNIKVDQHLFGADLSIRILGSGTAECLSLPKKDANKIKELLVDVE